MIKPGPTPRFFNAMNVKNIFVLGAILMAVGIVFGAFGAHWIGDRISLENQQTFETGVRYLIYHALAVLILSTGKTPLNEKQIKIVLPLIIVGLLFFSGSLFLLATAALTGLESWKSFLGPITPLGGTTLIVSWTLSVLYSFRSQNAG